jgi:hypothetical protein
VPLPFTPAFQQEPTTHIGTIMPDDFDPQWDGKSIPKHHWHFHRQLFARYGIVLAPGEFSEMLRDIKTGRAAIIERVPSGATIYMIRNIRLWKQYFVLVRDGYVVTALPPGRKLKRLRRRRS